MIDYTKLLNKLVPPKDGEDPLRIRSMTVTAINSNGTVNLSSGGVSIPQVPRLSGAFVAVGSAAQVLVHRGSLLVLGTVGGSPTVTETSSTSVPVTTTGWASSGFGAVFVASRTQVTIQIFDYLGLTISTSALRSVSTSTVVRVGGTIGSGGLIVASSENHRAILVAENNAMPIRASVSWSRPVGGLTPGETYNVLLTHSLNSSSNVTALSYQRSVTVLT